VGHEKANAMFGFRDYVINPRSGRPEPHVSWQAERVITWTGWVIAFAFTAGAAYNYKKWGDLEGAATMLGGAVLVSTISFARRSMLQRKQQQYREAVDAYEAALSKTAHDRH